MPDHFDNYLIRTLADVSAETTLGSCLSGLDTGLWELWIERCCHDAQSGRCRDETAIPDSASRKARFHVAR